MNSFEQSNEIKEIKKSVERAVSRFEQMQNAQMWSEACHSRSGEIDLNRLSEFSTHDDIFSLDTIFREGRNHAIIIAADFSSSMGNTSSKFLRNLVEKLLFTYLFCRELDIPIRIYEIGLRSGYRGYYEENDDRRNLLIDERAFHKEENEEILYALYSWAQNIEQKIDKNRRREKMNYRSLENDFSFRLGATPGHETMKNLVVDSYDILANPNIENKNVIIMSDGEWQYSENASKRETILLKNGQDLNIDSGSPAEAWGSYIKSQFGGDIKVLFNFYASFERRTDKSVIFPSLKTRARYVMKGFCRDFDIEKAKFFFDEERMTAFFSLDGGRESNVDKILVSLSPRRILEDDHIFKQNMIDSIDDIYKKKMFGEYAEFLLEGVIGEGKEYSDQDDLEID